MKKGFTLIELLVVISVIGILAAIGLSSFSSSQKQARDLQRKSDLRQYQNIFEDFANNNNNYYPSRTTARPLSTWGCNDLSMPDGCPSPYEDPKHDDDTTFTYMYSSNGAGGGSIPKPTATKYVIWGKLEDIDGSTTYHVICSDGRVGETTVWPPFSSGICPL